MTQFKSNFSIYSISGTYQEYQEQHFALPILVNILHLLLTCPFPMSTKLLSLVCVPWLTPCFHKGRPDISILVGDKPVCVSVEWFSNKKGIWTLLLPSCHILLAFSSSLHPPWRIPVDIPSRSKPHLSSADTVKGTAMCRDWGGNSYITGRVNNSCYLGFHSVNSISICAMSQILNFIGQQRAFASF